MNIVRVVAAALLPRTRFLGGLVQLPMSLGIPGVVSDGPRLRALLGSSPT